MTTGSAAAETTTERTAEQLAASVKWNNFSSAGSVVEGDAAAAVSIDHAIVQLDVAPAGFRPSRQLNVAACGVRFAVVGGPTTMRPEQIERRLATGTLCRDCLRMTIGELDRFPPVGRYSSAQAAADKFSGALVWDNSWLLDNGATDWGAAIWFEGETVRGYVKGQPQFESEAEAREWAVAELKRRGIVGEVRS